MYFITKDKVREAFRALRAEGYKDPKFEAVLEQLGGGSKTTLGKYYGPIKAEFDALDATGATPERNHRGGSMPLAQETGVPATAPAPVETTPLPKLFEARARYQAVRDRRGSVERRGLPMKRQIDTFKARQAQLMKERPTVATVERLRALKAELLSIEEELEIRERDFAQPGKSMETISREESRLRAACEAVRQHALKALETARLHHFAVQHKQYGANPRVLTSALEVLAEFVGEEDVEQYVTALKGPNETPRHIPPWDTPFWVDASPTTQG